MALTKINGDVIEANAISSTHLASGAVTHSSLSGITTDNVSEGSTNLYYTDARVGTYISGDRSFGNITTTGYIAGPATFTIDPAAVGDNTGTVVIAGNLQVDGTTTTINSTTMTVDDLNITLASGAANAAAANGAGITVDGASATITYDGTNDEWDFNKDITTTGYIGAGTSNPANLLHLESSGSNFATIRLNAPSNTTPGQFLLRAHDGVFDIRNANNSTTDLTIDDSGNVGIGTDTPGYNLHVEKSSPSANVDLLVKNTGTDGTSNSRIMSYVSGASGGDPKIGLGITAVRDYFWRIDNSDSDKLILDTNGTDIFAIDSSGNVGISNTSPDKMLTLGTNSDTSNPGYIRLRGHNTLEGNIFKSASYGIHMDTNSNNQGIRIDGGKLILGITGNVGIGTEITPVSKLHVEGKAFIGEASNVETEFPSSTATLHIHEIVDDADGVDLGNEAHVVISTGCVATGAQGYQGSLWFGTSDHPAAGSTAGAGNQFVWRNAGIASSSGTEDTGGGTGYGDLQFFVNNGSGTSTRRMTLTSNGRLGLGTDNPDALLDVNGVINIKSNPVIDSDGTSHYMKTPSGGAMYFYHGTTNVMYYSSNALLPGADNARNLGSTSNRWANVYTTDLHLSNEGKPEGNQVDGTTGNWTIQEGEDHLYIINNKNGKKYKFALEEIE